MSTTIKSAQNPDTAFVIVRATKSGELIFDTQATYGIRACINLNPADLLTALRAEGVLVADDGLRERIEALIKDRDARGFHKNATDAIREVLNPKPSFVFPTGLGAVVEGIHKLGVTVDRFTHSGPYSWIRESSGNPWNEDEIRGDFTDLRMLSEGLASK